MIQEYLDNIDKRYQLGNATEHTFRGDLQQLIEAIVPDVSATNEPKRQACGAPDYILTRKEVPVGFIEAKDIGDKDLDGKIKSGNKAQFDRYKDALGNLIFTDYLDFHLYIEGEFVTKVAIGEVVGNSIKPLPHNFERFESLINDFCLHVSQTIKSPKKLAEMMAGKARLLSDIIGKALISDELNQEDSTLKDQLEAFKKILIHDITPEGFADIYAQTIAYGMFAARLHDPVLETFSRQEAAELIPKSNPFLRRLFGYIAGPDLDLRIKWVIESLADIFLACNVEELLKDYGKSKENEDPIIHFYETFLSEYDPKLRKARGVWYTPKPVVDFMVRAVDDILKTEFDLPQGLADTSKTKVKVQDGDEVRQEEVHKVQILDPATGTGAYLAEVIKHIHKKFEGQQGIWSDYIENHLLPRLNGFELLMASYAMAHLQLDLLLKDTGFKSTSNQRLRVFLTNSLEKAHPDTHTLFAKWLSNEANEANRIKRDTPVMCVIGNPPYSGESSNKGDWIKGLVEDYKKEPGGKDKLNERNPKWLNDDYVKFIRFGQHLIEKNQSGVLAYINPHGFLDNPTFRGMRWHLLKTFDKIFTIDLHGNSKKKETTPDGGVDQNVFDIQQGVSINLFVKTGKKKAKALGEVHHYDLFGKRQLKYDYLNQNDLSSVGYEKVPNNEQMYYMVQKDFKALSQYESGFLLSEFFPSNSVGIVTSRDHFVVDHNKKRLSKRIQDFFQMEKLSLQVKYGLKENTRWKIDNVQKSSESFQESSIRTISYRPLDSRFIYYDDAFIERTRNEVMQHFHLGKNIGICLCRQYKSGNSFQHIFVTDQIIESSLISNRSSEITSLLPLYLYPTNGDQQTTNGAPERTPNLNPKIVKQIANGLGLQFTNEKEDNVNTFAPINLLDYIYAVLHSPAYREKYKEFLKIDFPRVPYPKDSKVFWQLVKLGGEVRQIHLLESPKVEQFITQYPKDGTNTVEKPKFVNGRVYINDAQYFENVPEVAWEFYIGGYQPAQKWLKDRKGRELNFEDIQHYQKIIVALTETDRLMQEIDKIDFLETADD